MHIVGTCRATTDGTLIDRWGRAFGLDELTSVGRVVPRRGLAILHGTISRCHAMISRSANGAWTVRDCASTNATQVNGRPVDEEGPVRPGDRLTFGAISLYFVRDADAFIDTNAELLTRRPRALTTVDGPGVAPRTAAAPPHLLPMRFVEAPTGGGGTLYVRGRQLRLSVTPFALLHTLAERMAAQAQVPALVRGFVPSGQLIADLPWAAAAPDETHLKQLVRRTRLALTAIGEDLIESRRGLGYRLRVMPALEDVRAAP